MIIIELLASTVMLMLNVVMYAMLARALLPIFINPEESNIYLLVCYITEPIIIPVRALFYAFNILQNSPIDWSFTATYFILVFIRMLLPAV